MYLFLSKKYKNLISLLFICFFCLGNLIWKSNLYAKGLTGFNQFFDYLAISFNSIGDELKSFFDIYSSYEGLKKEIEILRKQLEENKILNWKITELTGENKRLREVLDLRPKSKYETVQAKVISNNPDNWFKTIIIDKGNAHGLQNYMPVIANQVELPHNKVEDRKQRKHVEGLVGKIIQVNENSSRVLLISNSYSRLGTVIERTGHWALLEGQSPSNDLPLLRYINLKIKLKEGDKIITSGNQGVFPKGIDIGSIIGKPKRRNTFQEVRVQPFLDFQRLDYVYVIRKRKGVRTQKRQKTNAD